MSRKNFPTIGKILGVGERIKEIRGGLTQAVFAELLGIKTNALCRYEKGRIPDESILNKIAAYGNTTVKWLLRGDDRHAAQIQEYTPEDYSAALSDIETELLIQSVIKSEEVIKARRLKLTLEQKARLYVKVYDDCRAAHEKPSQTHVERILLLRD